MYCMYIPGGSPWYNIHSMYCMYYRYIPTWYITLVASALAPIADPLGQVPLGPIGPPPVTAVGPCDSPEADRSGWPMAVVHDAGGGVAPT